MRTYAIVAALALLLVTAVAAWVSGRLLSPLRTLRETADEITETDLSHRLPVTGNDDITALTRTFNGMLDRLEAAFVGQRQFLDDAGHELKTPLTVLRGHLELLDTDDAAEVAETRLLLLDEIDRMSRLVGDLILLAKSDRPDFLQPRAGRPRGLTADLLAKARGLGDRDWALDGDRRRQGASPTSSGSPRRCSSSPTTPSSTPRDGDTIAIGSSYDDADGPALGPRHRPRRAARGPRAHLRTVRPQRRTVRVTRASASASRSSARSPGPTAGTVARRGRRPGGRPVRASPCPRTETEDQWPAS